jgi:FkbM family methyltransferase
LLQKGDNSETANITENSRIDGYSIIDGVQFSLFDPDQSVSKETTDGLEYEGSVTTRLSQLLEENDRSFLDIGAHYGYYTIYVGKLNSTTRIYSFEPGAKHLAVLHKNIELNGINSRVFDYALSDVTQEIPFHNRTMKVKEGDDIEVVKAITFDELNAKENINPEIVKIDVHGAEGKVLYGMRDALKNSIKYLFIEIHASHLLVDYSHQEIVQILLESGFQLFEMDKFRDSNYSSLIPLTGESYECLINPDKWNQDQINRERMLYAVKE